MPIDAFRPDSAPPHLHMNFRVVDAHGRQLAMSRDLADLKRNWAPQTRAALADSANVPEDARHRTWDFGDLAEIMEIQSVGSVGRSEGVDGSDQTLVGYPALADLGDAVALQVFDSPERARAVHRAGVRRLLAITFRERVRDLEKAVTRDNALNLQFAQLAGDVALPDEIVTAAIERTFFAESLPTTQQAFERSVQDGRSRFNLIAQEIVRMVGVVLAEHAQLQKRLNAVAKAFPGPADEVRVQCTRLLHPRFVSQTAWPRLQHLPRYLKAAALRLDKLREDPVRDARLAAEIAPLANAWQREVATRARLGALTPELDQFGWLLEELRVARFAQALKTPVPVSVKRLTKLWQSIRHA